MESSPQKTDTDRILNGRYRLVKQIGSGGMASVYRTTDLILGRPVAVKLLHPGLTGDETFLDRFRKEAHSVANLAHPNIVTVHDIGQDEDQHYIVMEFVDGRTLKQVIRQQPGGSPLRVNYALDLAIKICDGLGYAHRSGIIHCDVKPQNVLVRHDERVKVTDFGIARAMSEATAHDGQVWGTPQYFSPEQAMGKPATPASDVYSIGIILFEMLTGKLPFTAESHTALALKHIHELPPSISAVNPAVQQQLEQLVFKALNKEPAHRFKTAGQFGRILSTYRRHGRIEDTNNISAPAPTDPYVPANHQRFPQTTPRTPLQSPASLPQQATQIFQNPAPRSRPQTAQPLPPSSRETIPPGQQHQDNQVQPMRRTAQASAKKSILGGEDDFLTIILGLIAFVLIVGLIFLYYMVGRVFGVF